ncbi:MAG: hypothetical protein WA123_12615 [Methylotenera sp.]
MKIAAILLVVGSALFSYALTLSPYKDEKLFMERYMSMSNGQSEQYWKLRDEMLTPKYQLQDYGVTLTSIAIAIFLVLRNGKVRIQSPKSRKTLVAVAITLPLLTCGGYVFDLLQGFDRGEFPHWADSMGIPLMGVPIQFVILLVWSFAHLAFLRGVYNSSIPLTHDVSLKANWWLLFVSAITAVLVFLLAAAGQYWYAVPGVLWLYFYLSLGAVQRVANGT